MGNLFGDLGFETANRKEFERLVRRAARSGSQAGRSGKFHYVLWTPGEGIELWVQMTAQETIIGCNPFFSGVSRIRMGVMQIAENPEHPVDGYFQGWASPEPQQTDAGLYPFAVDVPDFHLVKDKVLVSAVIHLQVSAFAEYLHCYQDDVEFHRRPLSDEEARLSSEAFIPVGVLDENGSSTQSQASFSGHVQSAEVRVNPITGRKFHALSVQTLGGVFDVVADPALVTGLPLPGGVIFGAFRLSAHLLRVGY